MTDSPLLISSPANRIRERQYAFQVILSEFLGLSYELSFSDVREIRLSRADVPGRLVMPDILLSTPDHDWRSPSSLPRLPIRSMPLEYPLRSQLGDDSGIPALYAAENLEQGTKSLTDGWYIPIDIFGSCFAMLTRYEELVASTTSLDEHLRFPARSSLVYRSQLLERPLVEDYLHLLVDSMNRLWPGSASVPNDYRVFVSHDVDHATTTSAQALRLVLRRAAGDLVRRRDPRTMTQRLISYFSRDANSDPTNTFAWLMSESERHGLRSIFYFMAASGSRFDSGYPVEAPFLAGVFKSIAQRGHEIGIHPSYRTSEDIALLQAEINRLERALTNAGVSEWSHASRQHYLRWNARNTWSKLAIHGLRQDSSVGFADAVGFRCGTSRAFSVFDNNGQQSLELKELPLIVMDATLTGRKYLALAWDDAISKAADLARTCRTYGAPFTLLWHNDRVITSDGKRQYAALLKAVT